MRKSGLGILLGLALLCVPAPAWAQVLPDQLPDQTEQNQLDRNNPLRDIRNNSELSTRINERQAVNLARQRFAGNILRISLVGEGPNQRYQIRMENEGKVFTVFVNATTGEVSGGT